MKWQGGTAMVLTQGEEATVNPLLGFWGWGNRGHKNSISALHLSIPPIVLNHVGQLDYELPLLVFLTQLKCLLIFPAQRGVAVLTVDVSNSVQPSEQQSLLSRTTAYVHHRVKEVGTSLTPLKRLGDEVIMVGQVCTTVNAAVSSVT